jgi:hypothetical protein
VLVFQPKTPGGAKSVSCGILDAKRLRPHVRARAMQHFFFVNTHE